MEKIWQSSLIGCDERIAPPTSNLNQLTQLFSSNGLTHEDMVTLSGEQIPVPSVNFSFHQVHMGSDDDRAQELAKPVSSIEQYFVSDALHI
ncbi:peroxidase 5 [Tanacetum coccineum]